MHDAFPRPPRRWPLGFLGMVALVLATERGLDAFVPTLVNMTQWDWRYANASLPEMARGRDLLGFGDSLAKFGIQPRVLEQGRPGRRVYNFAILCGQAPTSYFLLRRALDAGARPSALLLNARPWMLSSDLTINDLHWPELLTDRECLDLAWTARDPGFLARNLLALHLPSVREREALRKNLLAAFQGQDSATLVWNRPLTANIRLNQGAAVFWAIPNPPRTLSAIPPPSVPPGPWTPQPYHTAYLRRFFQLAASRNLPVYWVNVPECPTNEERMTRSGDRQRVDQYIRELQAEFPNVVAIRTPEGAYPDSLYHDDSHLGRHGATILSEDLAAVLTRCEGASADRPRAAELPRFVDRPDPIRLEDFSETTTAMLSAAATSAPTVRR